MKIVVTGGAGFIGSHLVEKLANEHDVTILDNLSTGRKEWVDPRAKLIKGDIRDIADVRKAMRGCEMVFHLAAIADARSSNADDIYAVDFLGSKNVFDTAKLINAKVVFASSAAVYGDAPPPHRDDAECKPISQYGKSKLRAEKICPEGSLILRFFNVYGPRGHGVINIFTEKTVKYEDVKIFGTGMQTRDYVHVEDVIEALLLGFKHSGIYNVGTGKETNLLDVIDLIQRISGIRTHKSFAMPKKEIQRSQADIARISAIWSPKISLKLGIKELISSIDYKPKKK
ncbi:MAG: NAD-dependent epimerase/dehydratase family protein [Candidatus Aenigmarchaeota archaeon]|nr:NAD-dependent epimerase/dehydratase family protein [Candidatus Aenigmarchaeota archaeon]